MTESVNTALSDEQVDAFLVLAKRNSGPPVGYTYEVCQAIVALCATVKALREKYVRLVEVSEEWARLLDRIRAWSKCDDGYPLDEHINNITINYGRLQSRLAEVERERDDAYQRGYDDGCHATRAAIKLGKG